MIITFSSLPPFTMNTEHWTLHPAHQSPSQPRTQRTLRHCSHDHVPHAGVRPAGGRGRGRAAVPRGGGGGGQL